MTVAPADTVTFLLTPLREGRRLPCGQTRRPAYFYSRPCGRGDGGGARAAHGDVVISTHAPAGGATVALSANALREVFLLTPLREGRRRPSRSRTSSALFLLTPLREGRRLASASVRLAALLFLLTPLREGRRCCEIFPLCTSFSFLLTPLREGRHEPLAEGIVRVNFYSRPCGRGDLCADEGSAGICDFYSRPCGRGDRKQSAAQRFDVEFLLTPLREGRPRQIKEKGTEK